MNIGMALAGLATIVAAAHPRGAKRLMGLGAIPTQRELDAEIMSAEPGSLHYLTRLNRELENAIRSGSESAIAVARKRYHDAYMENAMRDMLPVPR